jgi:hypothetical protein
MTSRAVRASLLATLLLAACVPQPRAAVSMKVVRHKAPADASVTIDEQYIGPLGYVAAHGVRVPLGVHRITVERPGYFPFDKTVEASRDPIRLVVELVPVPD